MTLYIDCDYCEDVAVREGLCMKHWKAMGATTVLEVWRK